jgi:Carboxypeptidase regulatory-like domain
MLNSELATVAAATNKVIGFRLTAIVLLLVGSCLLIPPMADAQCTPEPTTVLKGTVLLGASDKPTYAQGAKVIVQGEFLILSAVTDRDGKFRFSNMEPGTYTVETSYFGLHSEQEISVDPGTEVQVVLQLKLPDSTMSANP